MAETWHTITSTSVQKDGPGVTAEVTSNLRQPSDATEQPTLIDGKRVLTELSSFDQTAYAWSTKKKWMLLTVVAICQTSMNFNASIYSSSVEQLNHDFHITNARMGMVAFLVPYAFGCELWAPWSEELGRWKIMQLSLLGVNASILICALSPTFGGVLAGRVIGGLSSAGGSVTLGMVADMFDKDSQQHAVLWASLWSCLGAVIGGICGGPVEQYLTWRWNFWIQLIFSVATTTIHLFVAEESRSTILLDRHAKHLRKEGHDVYGPNEVRSFSERFNAREILRTMWRPYQMLICEPIVLFLSLLSGFADALIFSFFESYGIIFKQYSFTPVQISLALLALAGSYWLGYFSFFPVVARHNKRRARGEILSPETRLWWLLYLVVLLPVGLLGCAFLATVHWSGVVAFSVAIGVANYAIYYATVDYMVAAYGEYSASATGGNGFARDFLAGMCALYTGKMYHGLGVRDAQLLLFGLAVAFCIPVYVFYWKGPAIRKRSKFAMELAQREGAITHGNLQQQPDAPQMTHVHESTVRNWSNGDGNSDGDVQPKEPKTTALADVLSSCTIDFSSIRRRCENRFVVHVRCLGHGSRGNLAQPLSPHAHYALFDVHETAKQAVSGPKLDQIRLGHQLREQLMAVQTQRLPYRLALELVLRGARPLWQVCMVCVVIFGEAVGAAVGAEVGRLRELCAGVEAFEEDRVRVERCSCDKAIVQDAEDEGVDAVGEDGQREEFGRRKGRQKMEEQLVGELVEMTLGHGGGCDEGVLIVVVGCQHCGLSALMDKFVRDRAASPTVGRQRVDRAQRAQIGGNAKLAVGGAVLKQRPNLQPTPGPPQQQASDGQNGRRDNYDTDAESLDTTTHRPSVHVADNPHQQPGQDQYDGAELESEYTDEEYEEEQLHGYGEEQYPQDQHLAAPAGMAFFGEGNSYPSTTSGPGEDSFNNWNAGQEHVSNHVTRPREVSNHPPAYQPVPNLAAASATLKKPGIMQQSAGLRQQDRSNPSHQQRVLLSFPGPPAPPANQLLPRLAQPALHDLRQNVQGPTVVIPQRSARTKPGPIEVRPTVEEHALEETKPDLEEREDYDHPALFQMKYDTLKNESFDTVPRPVEQVLPREKLTEPVEEQLQYAMESLDPQKQYTFFQSLKTQDWEEAGDWFLERFGDILQRTTEARQKKRKLARGFEDEVEKRYRHVEKRQHHVKEALDRMKKQGEGLMPRSPRASKEPRDV
ncbi:MFS general substrate transporter [Massarina eburnea CBS 473.64]|uniref:MFS general substrate transporter n=1 Tax=Massarina eburnea CBS 473.64 TaxID=1395130 RepID=A0A6A6RMV0_9PLEO|nr:MFS general substrate transporter [Massarina eburnea CBS 473.64]